MRHFKKLRLLFMASGVASPLIFFTAFVLFAAGQQVWAFLLVLLAGTLGLSFPILEIGSPEPVRPERGPRLVIRMLAFALTTYWALHIPEVGALLDRLLEGALWDWRVITAAALWALLTIHSNLQAIRRMTDEMIYHHFDKGRTSAS